MLVLKLPRFSLPALIFLELFGIVNIYRIFFVGFSGTSFGVFKLFFCLTFETNVTFYIVIGNPMLRNDYFHGVFLRQ